jgi:general secretion pathway protein C
VTGQANPIASLQSRFKLLGVIAQSSAGAQGTYGSALIAVDGTPAKPYRVGQLVADDLTLQSVQARSAALGTKGQSQAAVTLDLPMLQGMSPKQ